MTVTPPAAERRSVTRELVRVWSVGLLAAAGLGVGGALIRPELFWQAFVVVTACSLGPCIGLAWLTVGAGRRVEIDARAEENVETRWLEKAASGALLDVLVTAGLLAGAMSVFGFGLPGDGVLLGIWAFALIDGALRYALIRRRES